MTSRDIATTRGEVRSGTQLYRRANFPADRRRRRPDIPGRTKIRTTYVILIFVSVEASNFKFGMQLGL